MELNDLDPKQIKALIGLLSSMLDKQPSDEENETESVIKSRSSKAKKQKGKKSINLFDQLDTRNLHKDDSEIDKKLLNKQPSPRLREMTILKVRCRKCGVEQEISSSLVMDKNRYKCNDCSRTPG